MFVIRGRLYAHPVYYFHGNPWKYFQSVIKFFIQCHERKSAIFIPNINDLRGPHTFKHFAQHRLLRDLIAWGVVSDCLCNSLMIFKQVWISLRNNQVAQQFEVHMDMFASCCTVSPVHLFQILNFQKWAQIQENTKWHTISTLVILLLSYWYLTRGIIISNNSLNIDRHIHK
jgi:hypothetical protein